MVFQNVTPLFAGTDISESRNIGVRRESSMLECTFVLASAHRNPYSQYIANNFGGHIHFIGDMA